MSEPTQTAQPTAVQIIEQAVQALERVKESTWSKAPAHHIASDALALNPLAAAQSMERVAAALTLLLERIDEGHLVATGGLAARQSEAEARAALDALTRPAGSDGAG